MMLRLSSEQDAAHKGSTTGGVPAGGTSQSHSQCLWQPCHSASRSSGNEPRDATVKADQQSFFVSEACDGGAGWTIEKSKANGSSYKPRINKSAGLFLFGRVGSIIGPPLFLMRLLVIPRITAECLNWVFFDSPRAWHMGNIGSSPTKVWEVTYMSCGANTCVPPCVHIHLCTEGVYTSVFTFTVDLQCCNVTSFLQDLTMYHALWRMYDGIYN